MRKPPLVFLLLLSGCHSDLSESRVEKDFHVIVESKYPEIKVLAVKRVAFGDGWDDGVEVKLFFDGSCDKSIALQTFGRSICTGETAPMVMEISYQRDGGGSWQVLATAIEAR